VISGESLFFPWGGIDAVTRSSTRLSVERARSLATLLEHAVSDEEADRFIERVQADIDASAVVETVSSGRRQSAAPSDVTINPGAVADPHNAFLATCRLAGGDGPLSGMTVAVKDNIAVAGVPMTCGSRVLEHAVPGEHATVVNRLLAAGATLVGKTNMDEMAYGPTSETSQFGPVSNPADSDRVAGGSSSGSAAAVAAGDVDIALGTDTGGSIRIPSSLCGTVGFKPSYGAVSRAGVVDLAPTMDHVGPIAPDVETAALCYDAIAGTDRRDPATAAADALTSAATAVTDPPALSDCSFGVPEAFFADRVGTAVEDRIRSIIERLEAAGATVEPVSLPTVPSLEAVWKTVANVELAAMLWCRFAPVARRRGADPAWYGAAADALQSRGHDLGETIRAATVAGAQLLTRGGGRRYTRALAACEQFATEVDSALDGHDALLGPTTPAPAPVLSPGGDTRRVPLAYNTRPADIAHVPAVSLPAGRTDGLPIGLQLYGHRGQDASLLGVSKAIEATI